MKSDKLMTGLVLVLIGVAFLLHNFGYINFHWSNLFHLWPVFLLMAGVNLILSNNHTAWAAVIKALVVIGGFSIILFANTRSLTFGSAPGMHFNYSDDDDDDDDTPGMVKINGASKFKEQYTADTRFAQLNISGGGTTYVINDTTGLLLDGNTQEFGGRYELTRVKKDSLTILGFRMRDRDTKKGHSKFEWDSDKGNIATLKLNPNPEWDITVKTGASKIDFDLTKFKIRSVKLNGGAAELNVKLGQPVTSTNVDVSTGVSEINISVPKSAACSITTSSGLSSTNFDGFNEVGDHHYETPGFANSPNKIYIKMNGGLSDFNVKRY
jgi:hypothetical protein